MEIKGFDTHSFLSKINAFRECLPLYMQFIEFIEQILLSGL
jgi:hypothetical protein